MLLSNLLLLSIFCAVFFFELFPDDCGSYRVILLRSLPPLAGCRFPAGYDHPLTSAPPPPVVATVADPPYKVVCYFESWAVYRPGNGIHDVEDIEPDLCTHHIYTFAGLNSSHQIHSLDPYHDLYDNYGEGKACRSRGGGGSG